MTSMACACSRVIGGRIRLVALQIVDTVPSALEVDSSGSEQGSSSSSSVTGQRRGQRVCDRAKGGSEDRKWLEKQPGKR